MSYSVILNAAGLAGVRARRFQPGSDALSGGSIEYTEQGGLEITDLSGNEPVQSLLGTPVFSNLVLRSLDSSQELRIDTVLFTVTMSRNIVKTAIQGRNGTVKEYVSDGDFVITVSGSLVGERGQYPTEDFQALLGLLSQPAAIEVVSDYLQLFGIFNIVVENYSFRQQPGTQNIQAFELTCSSDAPIELIIDA